jgi:gliding motility-associated-like protein
MFFCPVTKLRLLLLALLCGWVTPDLHAQVWQRNFGREGRSNLCTHSIILKNGNRVAVGYAYDGINSAGSATFAMCANRGDSVLWAVEGGTPNRTNRFIYAYPTKDSGFVAVGYGNAFNSATQPSALVVKYRANGAVQWSRMLKGSSNGECFWTVTEMPGTGHIVCAGAYDFTPSTIGGLLVDMDAAGNLLWSKMYDNAGSDAMWGLVPFGNDLFVVGYSQTGTLYDGYLLRVDESNGNLRWSQSFDMTSSINANTGQWPQALSLVDNRLYSDTYCFNAFSFNNVHHALVSFDTAGKQPHCLEYKLPGSTYSNSASSLVRSASEIYLAECPGTASWDMHTNNNNQAISEMTMFRIRSLNATGLTPVFCRSLSNPGAQSWRHLDYENGRLISFQASQGDTVSRIGYCDIFKIETDTAFSLTDTSCATDMPAPQFANPAVTINTNFRFAKVSPVSWSTNTTNGLFTTNVPIESTQPCTAPDTVINRYAAVLGEDPCSNSFLVDSSLGFLPGDTILVIQMKGATIDSSNTASFGTVLDPAGAGLFERNIIRSVNGNSLSLINRLSPELALSAGKLQFVTIPRFGNYTVRKRLTAMGWNGLKGGVCIFDVTDTLRLNAAIDVSGKGFAGGLASTATRSGCGRMDYFYPAANNDGAAKGEGIAALQASKSYGRGAVANGGGGGNDFNAGGGGGSNGGPGGKGGNQQLTSSCQTPAVNGGIGGWSIAAPAGRARVFLGGGGGAGHGNNGGAGSGGAGGGIVMLKAGVVTGDNRYIIADGQRAPHVIGPLPGFQDDGRGGGGGGGMIITDIRSYARAVRLSAAGGRGSGAISTTAFRSAPGGGGGGGIIWFAGNGVPDSAISTAVSGANGRTISATPTIESATSGDTGKIRGGFLQPPMRDSFRKNVITATIFDTLRGCRGHHFGSSVTTSITGIRYYTWHFGDGTSSTQRSTRHFYRNSGTYHVKLLLVDSNGCRDSAMIPLTVSCRDTVINRYAAILSANNCDNSFLVDTAAGFAAGDTVLLIQSQGVVIDDLMTPGFGTFSSLGNGGNFELQLVSRVSGNNIALRNQLSRTYDFTTGNVQLVRIPRYGNYTVSQPHVAMPWNGRKGGVLAMNVTGTLTLNDELDVSGRGFRGGIADTIPRNAMICNVMKPIVVNDPDSAARKGEGIGALKPNASRGLGAWGTGGGGGGSFNAGGGGGSNVGSGGHGGSQSSLCLPRPISISGLGGWPLTVYRSQPRLFMGGGGGAGHSNDGTPSHGGNGGGIILLSAGTISGGGLQLNAAGAAAHACEGPAANCQDDGGGGGGAGGNVMLNAGSMTSTLKTNVSGGAGADVYVSSAHQNDYFGPGGGGGNGAVWLGGLKPALLEIDTTNGTGGRNLGTSPINGNYGSDGTGAPVSLFTGVGAPAFSSQPFIGNRILATLSDSVISCFGRRIGSAISTTTSGVSTLTWTIPALSDTAISRSGSFSYTFPGYGNYQLRLVVVDRNGCTDTSLRTIAIARRRFANAGRDTILCRGAKALLQASGGVRYSWSPAAALSDPESARTFGTIDRSQYFTVIVTDSIGCLDYDTVLLRIGKALNPVQVQPSDTSVCRLAELQLHAVNGHSYSWEPRGVLSSDTAADPELIVPNALSLRVTARDTNGCISEAIVNLNVLPAPNVEAYTKGDAISCNQSSIRIYARGTDKFVWHPGHLLDDSTSDNPVLTTTQTVLMELTGTDRFGCTAADTMTVFAMTDHGLFMPNAFTPNGDGRNDDIRPYNYCNFKLESFRIFNRWGECVFYGYRPNHAWNGTYNGQQAELGTYYYLIQGRNNTTGEAVTTKGDLLLIR